MTLRAKPVVSILFGLVLAACSAGDDGFVEPTSARMVELEKIIEAVDWSKAEERSLLLDEFEFTPASITSKRGQPYELTITNKGWTAHNFVAPGFFDAVAVRGLIFSDGEVSMPLLKSIAFEAGETKVLVFVPLRAGEFPLLCDQPLHEIFGMTGTIRIE